MRPDHSRHHQSGTQHGFTAVVCHGPACGRAHGEQVVAGLRECVRRNQHGVLVSAGCLLGRLGCHALSTAGPHHTAGTLLVVQPCAADRTPTGPAVWIGPLAGADDLAAVRRWLAGGDLSTIALPAHLRFRAALAGRGTAN